MTSLSRNAWLRIVPFAAFVPLAVWRAVAPAEAAVHAQGLWSAALLLALAWLVAHRREYGELARPNRPSANELGRAVAVGALVAALWIALDAPWMVHAGPAIDFVPLDARGRIDWPLAAWHSAGVALVVPIAEELFWRSFVMRWFDRAQFEALPPARVSARAVFLSTFVYALSHTMWLAAAVAGLAYALLYLRSGTLWSAVAAHMATNGVLAAWALVTQQWQLW